ncbi:MFS transporter [Candidatus Bathyarchaeota archaeon]|nr:MFS transporter [Candidatus Bathyarchaeota archaeon]
MAPLDGSIVTIAIPSIASSMMIGLETVVWISLAYLLVLTVLLINAGRLADIRGRKRTYILGFIIFTAGSILCGASATGLQLVIFRAVQGVGAAFIASNSPAIVTESFQSWERGKALGINATAVYAGLMTGPVIGGILVQNFGWRSIFYVNVPIGILVVSLASLKLKEKQTTSVGERFDFVGAVTLSVALASFLVALTLSGAFGWSSIPILSLLLLTVSAFVLFIYTESRLTTHPTFDLSLFTKNRLFAAANTAALLNYIAVSGVTFMISIYLQDILGLPPQSAGLFLIAMAVAMALLSPFSGWLSDRFGSRLLSSGGMLIVTVGLLLLSQLNTTSSVNDIVLRLTLLGVGFGLFSSPNTRAVMSSVDRSKLGVASGTISTMRSTGQAIGLAMAGAVIATALPPQAVLQLFTGLSAQSAIARDEFIMGMSTVFQIASAISAVGTLASLVRGRESTNEMEESHRRSGVVET